MVLFSEEGTVVVFVMFETILALSGMTISGTFGLLLVFVEGCCCGCERNFIILRKRSGVLDRDLSGVLCRCDCFLDTFGSTDTMVAVVDDACGDRVLGRCGFRDADFGSVLGREDDVTDVTLLFLR